MIESLKALWAKWKVQISIVGGVLVLSTVWGTCSYTPAQVEEAEESSEESQDGEEASNSSEAPAEVEATSANVEATSTTTTENNTVEAVGNDN